MPLVRINKKLVYFTHVPRGASSATKYNDLTRK